MADFKTIETPDLIKLRARLDAEADDLRAEEERLRDEASDLEDEARQKESESEAIGKELNRREGLTWGVEISEAISGIGRRLRFRFLGADWLSNGSFAWRVDDVPAGWAPPPNEDLDARGKLEADLLADCYAIDLANPVATHDGARPYNDFATEGGPVRYDARYCRAVKSCGDRVGVTKNIRCLVAYRDGQPTAMAMRLYNDGER
jgi:hypothetical protein